MAAMYIYYFPWSPLLYRTCQVLVLKMCPLFLFFFSTVLHKLFTVVFYKCFSADYGQSHVFPYEVWMCSQGECTCTPHFLHVKTPYTLHLCQRGCSSYSHWSDSNIDAYTMSTFQVPPKTSTRLTLKTQGLKKQIVPLLFSLFYYFILFFL